MRLSIRGQLVKPLVLMDEGLLSISPACCGQLVEILITLESYGIFGSKSYVHLGAILQPHEYKNEICFYQYLLI